MLFVVSDALRRTKSINDVARDLSLSIRYFDSPGALSIRMAGQMRRIVLLGPDDVTRETITRLRNHVGRVPFGIIVAADRAAISRTTEAELIGALLEFRVFEWVGSGFNALSLGDAIRRCRRRLLRFNREEIERAFDDFEFSVRYQPKVERGDGQVWQTREVEAYESMPRLTEFVLRKSANQIIKWRDQGLGFDVCVNMASSQLGRPGIAARYATVVREHGADCPNFTLEVIEQDLADPSATHRDTLCQLRELGFRVCLDNFRVAARSLTMLENLPFDEIKIHASALKRAQGNDVSRYVLAAIVGLAHNLGMAVCAEGVEDQETFEFLKTIRCDKLQGFLISEAVLPHIVRKAYSATESASDEVA
jgi:EAL domain-containing protein (putative c-di-GMP-specific phosphodiesterase class I)